MKTYEKLTALLLACLMAVSVFAGCNTSQSQNNEDSEQSSESSLLESVTEVETEATPMVDRNDYNSDFFISIYHGSNVIKYHWVEESENDVLSEATMRVQPPTDKGKRLKIYYMTQISVAPPTFVIFCNNEELFHFSYQRYIENCLRETFGFVGTPIKLIIRERGEDNK